MTEKWATGQSCIHIEITSGKVPSLLSNYSKDLSVHFQPSVVCRRLIEHKFQPRRNLTYNEP